MMIRILIEAASDFAVVSFLNVAGQFGPSSC
jgi:hypothetical protein